MSEVEYAAADGIARLDGITRHTEEGYAFHARAASQGFKAAVRARDEPFGDLRR